MYEHSDYPRKHRSCSEEELLCTSFKRTAISEKFKETAIDVRTVNLSSKCAKCIFEELEFFVLSLTTKKKIRLKCGNNPER